MLRLAACVLALTTVAHAADLIVVGDTPLNVPIPSRMVEVPAGHSLEAEINLHIPPNATCLRKCVAPSGMQTLESSAQGMRSFALVLAPHDEKLQHIKPAQFARFIELSSRKLPNDFAPQSDADAARELAIAWGKPATSVSITGKPAACLGSVLQGRHYVSFLFTRRYTLRIDGHDYPLQSYSTVSYIHAGGPVLVTIMARIAPDLHQADVDLLQKETKTYSEKLATRNNP